MIVVTDHGVAVVVAVDADDAVVVAADDVASDALVVVAAVGLSVYAVADSSKDPFRRDPVRSRRRITTIIMIIIIILPIIQIMLIMIICGRGRLAHGIHAFVVGRMRIRVLSRVFCIVHSWALVCLWSVERLLSGST
jgi:hypothetical protein